MGARRSELARAAVAAGLSGMLVVQPLLAQDSAAGVSTRRHGAAAQPAGEIQGRARVLHALNRLTFGPRPGDVEAVEKMGLDRWFEQQLQPASIDDAALNARLQEYPAMSLSIAELEARYPGPQLIRQILAGRASLPTDPTERVMIDDQVAFYKMQRAKQEAKVAGDDAKGVLSSNAMQASGTAVADAGEMTGEADVAQLDRAARNEELARIMALPPQERYQTVLQLSPRDLIRLRQALRGSAALQLEQGMTAQQKETLAALGGSLQMVRREAAEARLERDIFSNRQIEAVMTDFWLNHFNVYLGKNQQEPYLIPTYERETIRRNALGNFEDLLVATATSPAMLEYLDNARSEGPHSTAAERAARRAEVSPTAGKGGAGGLNENYGRELMELHTLGVGGGYTQADVTNLAKVLTGWTVVPPGQQNGGSFVFNENRHEPGSKTVLGTTVAEGGYREGLQVLHMLASSPATANFIAQKLAVRFVSDTPPPALVERMAKAFLASHGDIKTVLRAMWNSPEFWSTGVYRAKVKTPEEYVVSAVRASGAEVTQAGGLVQAISKLGMPLYGMQTPNGYSWKQDEWVSTGALVSRMNFALVLSGNRIPGVHTDWGGLADDAREEERKPGNLPAASSSTARTESQLELGLIGQPVSEKTRAAVLSQASNSAVTEQAATQFDLGGKAGDQPGRYRLASVPALADAPPADPQAAVMAGLLLGSPEFQRR